VNPGPTLDPIADMVLCNGETSSAVNFGSDVDGTSYTWESDNEDIGLDASGNGHFPSFIAENPGTVPVEANITVTSSANTCSGTTETFKITVNPTPTVDAESDQAICNGAASTLVTFAGSSVAGTVYNWTNDKTSIGLAAIGS